MATKMETLRAQMPKEKAQKVKETAMKEFEYSKGAISMAITEALDDWLHKKQAAQPKNRKPDWGAVTGALKEIKMSSVELQHHSFQQSKTKHAR